MPLFENIKTNAGTQPKNELGTEVSFGMVVAFMMFIKKRRRNRRKPPPAAEIFLPFLAEL